MMPRLLTIMIILWCSGPLFSQDLVAYENLLIKGKGRISTLSGIQDKMQHEVHLESNEKIFALYLNDDTTRVIFLTETISDYDPTNDIRNDEHNKVNFITSDAFKGKNSPKHQYRLITVLYYPADGNDVRWYTHYSTEALYYPADSQEGQLRFIAKAIPPVFLDTEKKVLVEDYWNNGLFAPTPDLRLDPRWNSYGKNVWKEKEQNFRPYIGVPKLVRLAWSEEKAN